MTTDHTTLTADNLTDRLAPAPGDPAADLVRAAREAAKEVTGWSLMFRLDDGPYAGMAISWAALLDDLALALQLAAAEAAGVRELVRLRAEAERVGGPVSGF